MLFLLPAAFAASPTADLLDSVRQHLDHGEGCLTPLVQELNARADELTPDERREATRLLTPWKADLRAPVLPLRSAPPPPDGVPTEPCFSWGANRITSEHFAVEWDGNTISEGTAQDFIDALEDGYRVEVQELGWLPPLQGDDYLVLAYVTEGNYQGAYTYFETCGNGIVPYIVAYAGSFSSPSWAKTMAVHEFNHALQFGYGFAWEFWWYEATATYVESQVYPTSDIWAGYVTGYTQNPQLAFNASKTDSDDQDVFWHQYGMAIWATYMDEYLGGPDTVRASWEAADNERGTYSFGMQEAFEEMGLDFDAAYKDFVIKNVVMLYESQNVLPSVDEYDSLDDLPVTVEVTRDDRPQGYGQVYTRIEKEAGEGDLVITFDGDEDVPWSVQVVELDRDEILRVVVADVVDGQGEVTLPDFGEEDVMLVVSPLVSDDSRYGYEWHAELVEPAEDLPMPDEDGLEKGAGDEDPAAACGCASGGDGVGALGLLLGVGLLARRRR